MSPHSWENSVKILWVTFDENVRIITDSTFPWNCPLNYVLILPLNRCLISLFLFLCQLCWLECLSILWCFVEDSWNHYKHASVDLPVEKPSSQLSHKGWKQTWNLDLISPSIQTLGTSSHCSQRDLFFFFFLVLFQRICHHLTKAHMLMMKMYYFINSQPKFASLYAGEKSGSQINSYSVQKENLKSVSNIMEAGEFSMWCSLEGEWKVQKNKYLQRVGIKKGKSVFSFLQEAGLRCKRSRKRLVKSLLWAIKKIWMQIPIPPYILALRSWRNYLMSLRPDFLICKKGILVVWTS